MIQASLYMFHEGTNFAFLNGANLGYIAFHFFICWFFPSWPLDAEIRPCASTSR